MHSGKADCHTLIGLQISRGRCTYLVECMDSGARYQIVQCNILQLSRDRCTSLQVKVVARSQIVKGYGGNRCTYLVECIQVEVTGR